ncbi:zinc finger protein [Apis mellifera caucasica]|nr:zinc finger protein [Apis mellifera caucasica]
MQERRFNKIIHWMYNIQYKMKSMKAKTKAKKPNGKFGKVKFPSKEITHTDQDLSQLYPPIDTSISTLYRLSKILENGSDEVKSILTYECDLLYECRICRSLFRSLINFISHKRVYCKQKFDVTFAKKSSNDYDITSTSKSDIQKSQKLFEESCGNDRILRSQVCKEVQKKDLTTVVNMLQKKQIENLQTNTEQLCLEIIHSNSSAVYQTIESVTPSKNHTDLMKAQIMELKDTNEQTAVLGVNGRVLQSNKKLNNNNTTQIHNNTEIGSIRENELICRICYAKFSTKKTLTVHTRTLHTSHRLCYPCPCCSSTFANTWSVYRHLFKVHRKSNEQVRKLRPQIQEKAFIKDTTAAEDLQKEDASKTLMNNAVRVNETQEWIDHLESDTELQRCGGCGKRFDRKAALSAHLTYCHRRVAAYENITKIKKINKVPSDCTSNENIIINSETQENKAEVSTINNTNETSIRVEAIASLSKADWDMLGNEELVSQNKSNENVLTNGIQRNVEDNHSSASDVSDPLEIVYTNINKHEIKKGSKKRKNKDSIKRVNNAAENIKDISVEENMEHNVEEKLDHILSMEKKITSIVDFQKLQCLPCKRKFPSVNNLRRHAAIHIGWNRYQCKLCDYKCFDKCDCIAHCNKIHNAQNNRALIEEMIIQILDDQYTYDQNITLDVTNLEEKIDIPKVVEVNICVEHVEPEIQVEEKNINVAEIEIIDKNNMEPEIQVEEKSINLIETEVIDKSSLTCCENIETQETSNNDIKGQNTLNLDPDLRRMVMEVIFGSSEIHSTKADIKETISSENSNSKALNTEDIEVQGQSSIKENDIKCIQDSKPQRPIRNKIKPLNKDFIYDLKEVAYRKDSLIMKSFNKSLNKKSPVQEEDNLEKDLEQPSKRFKSIENDEILILCENNAIVDRCEISLDRDLKNNFSFSQCHN